MYNYIKNMDVSGYVTGVTTNITQQVKRGSVTSVVIGNAFTDLANLTQASVNAIILTGGTGSGVTTFSGLTGKPTTLSGYSINSSDTLFDSKYYPLGANPHFYLTTITSGNVITALGYTPSSGGTGVSAFSGLTGVPNTLQGYGVSSGDTTFDNKYYLSANPKNFITGVTFSGVTNKPTTLSGYGLNSGDTLFDTKYYLSTNPTGYITGVTSGSVTTALGYTPQIVGNYPTAIILSGSGVLHTSPTVFNISGGTATAQLTLATQAANTVLRGPISGTSATPSFGPLVANDIPNLSWNKITNGVPTTLSGYTISSADTLFDFKYLSGVSFTNLVGTPNILAAYGITVNDTLFDNKYALNGVSGATLFSPSFSGTPTAPTPITGTSTNQIATTQFVQQTVVAYFDASKNLFNPLTSTANNYIAYINGNLTFNTGYTASDYIPISGSVSYARTNQNQLAFYNSGKTYMSGLSGISNTNDTFVTPSGSSFMRLSVLNTYLPTFQVEVGSGSTSYQPFTGATIKQPYIVVPDSGVTNSKIIQGAVAPDKTTFFQVGKNLFNPAAMTAGYYVGYSTGALAANGIYNASDYISISGSTSYAITNQRPYAFYTSGKTYISGVSASTGTASTFTTPSNASFVRVSMLTTETAAYQIEVGTASTIYAAYTYLIGQGFLPGFAVANGSVTTNTIVDGSVTPAKVNFLQPGTNLFNINATDVTLGSYVSYVNGVTSVNAGYNTTGYMPVVAGNPYTMSFKHQIAWYNSSKIYVTGNSSSDSNVTQTAPAGAAYLRCSVAIASWNSFMINAGSSILPYAAYGYVLQGYFGEPILTPGSSGGTSSSTAPGIAFPVNYYMLGGYENTIYFKATTEKYKPHNYFPTIEGGVFISESNKARIPSGVTITPGTVTAKLYDDNFAISSSKTLTINVSTASTNNGPLILNTIGDSYTYNGSWLTKVKAICPALSFTGMRKPYNDLTLLAEGRGGWTLNQYFTQFQSNTDSFTPFMHLSGYTYYGNTDFWKHVTTGDTGYSYFGFNSGSTFNSSTGFKASPVTNDLMWDSVNGYLSVYNGAAWTTTTATTSAFTFNYAKYRSTWSISQPDIVPILLGLNDFRNAADKATVIATFATWQTQMETLIASIHADTPSAKIVILLPNSNIGSWDNDTGQFVIRQNYMMWQARNLIINAYDNRQGSLIYVVDTGSSIDPDYGFSYNNEPPFQDYSGTEVRKVVTNSPHPSTQGYYQMGIPLAAFIQKIR